MLKQSEKDSILKHWNTNHNASKITTDFGYSTGTVSKVLKEFGIIPSKTDHGSRKGYSLNDNYFDVIDTEEKEYWLGFLSRDGSLKSSNKSLTLTRKDRDHIEKLRLALSCTKEVEDFTNIRNGKENLSSKLQFASPGTHRALTILGQSKLKIERDIPIVCENSRHFWRGCWDADGSIGKKKTGEWFLNYCGNDKWCQAFIDFTVRNGLEERPMGKGDGCKLVEWYKNEERERLLHLLYDEATIYLDRKKKLIDEFLTTEHTSAIMTKEVKTIPVHVLEILKTPAHLEYDCDGIVRQWSGHFGTLTQTKDAILLTNNKERIYAYIR